MVAECAYCKAFIGFRDPVADPAITHGACDACVERLLRDFDAEMQKRAPWFQSSGTPGPNRLCPATAVAD